MRKRHDSLALLLTFALHFAAIIFSAVSAISKHSWADTSNVVVKSALN